jgi:CheY-like chemotaxis protein
MRDNKKFIIYVDDSPVAREMVMDGLKDTDYLLETANDAADLETKHLSDLNTLWQVDLFIFDFDMPEMTGTQIASVLDQLYKGA